MSDIWMPITICLSLGFVAAVRLWLNYKYKAEIQQTIRKALDKGEHLSIDVLERLGAAGYSYSLDLRRAIMLLALGIAIIVASYLINFLNVGLAIGAFPISLAIAFLLLYKIGLQDETSSH